MKAKSFAAICLPVWNAHEWDSVGATVHVTLYIWASVCPCGVCGALGKGLVVHVSFWGFLFVCKWCALELGICIGTQDCLCQCDMLKHSLFFQCCHIRAVWTDTYRRSSIYIDSTSLPLLLDCLKEDFMPGLYLSNYTEIQLWMNEWMNVTHKKNININIYIL